MSEPKFIVCLGGTAFAIAASKMGYPPVDVGDFARPAVVEVPFEDYRTFSELLEQAGITWRATWTGDWNGEFDDSPSP